MSLFVGAAVGAVFGVAYQSFRRLTAPLSYSELVPRPECFDMDPQIAYLFISLAPFRQLDDAAYTNAMFAMDNLLKLENALVNDTSIAEIGDITTAELYADKITRSMQLLVTKSQISAKIQATVEEIKVAIDECVIHHLKIIVSLCEQAR